MTAYATRADVFKYGLARGALGNPGRLVSSSLAATDTIELQEHGFETNDPVLLRATDGGTLSAPLVAGTTYYAIRLSASEFQVAAAPNGSAIDLTTDGVSMLVSVDLPFDDVLEFYSRFADGFLPAHFVPLKAPYPITVVGTVAQLAARRLQIIAGQTSETMKDAEIAAKAQLERWAAGLPVRDYAALPSPSNIAVNAALGGADNTLDPRGWGSQNIP